MTPEAKLPPIFFIINLLSPPRLCKIQVLIVNMTIDIVMVTLALRKWRESMIGLTVWSVNRFR